MIVSENGSPGSLPGLWSLKKKRLPFQSGLPQPQKLSTAAVRNNSVQHNSVERLKDKALYNMVSVM